MAETVITGANGFLGQHLMELLPDAYPVSSQAYDLRKTTHVEALFKHTGKVKTLYHLAATVGGIGANRLHPYLFWYDNLTMGINIIDAAIKHGVEKVVMVGTTCSYPKFAAIPFNEKCLFDGYPEETNAPYGIVKRNLLVGLQAAQREHNLRFAYIIPTNLYGPGDNFDDSTSHVIPALIKKCLSGENEIEVWGTGEPSRDFIYVKDAAKAIKLAGDIYDRPEPLNIGSGNEVRIHSLLHLIVQITGFCGKIKYDKSKPDGQPRRVLNINAARDALGWQPETSLKDGLRKTIEWYKSTL